VPSKCWPQRPAAIRVANVFVGATREGGPLALDVSLARVDRLSTGARYRETGDGPRLAPPWLSDVLDLEESQAGDEGGLGSNQLRGRRA
jgi:hypothetical protein